MNITIQHHERQIGPFTVEEINRRLREGTLKPDDWAWPEGASDWVPLKTIPGVGVAVSANAVPQPRVVKPKSYQNHLVWCGVALAVLLLIDIGIRVRANSRTGIVSEMPPAQAQSPAKTVVTTETESNTNPASPPILAAPKNTPPPVSPPTVKTAKASRIRGTVMQVTEKGLLVIAKEDAPVFAVGNSTGNGGGVFIPTGRTDKHGAGRPAEIYGNFFVSGHPKQATLVDDAEIDVDAYQDGVVSYTTAIGARRTVKRYAVSKAFE